MPATRVHCGNVAAEYPTARSWPGCLAETRREIGGTADVVVAVEDEDLTVGYPAAQGEGLTVVAGDEFDGGCDGRTVGTDHGIQVDPAGAHCDACRCTIERTTSDFPYLVSGGRQANLKAQDAGPITRIDDQAVRALRCRFLRQRLAGAVELRGA